jgi:hypothetical protein
VHSFVSVRSAGISLPVIVKGAKLCGRAKTA